MILHNYLLFYKYIGVCIVICATALEQATLLSNVFPLAHNSSAKVMSCFSLMLSGKKAQPVDAPNENGMYAYSITFY